MGAVKKHGRTVRAPSSDTRFAAALAGLEERRRARTAARDALLAEPIPSLPTPDDLGVPKQPMRQESAAAARTRRLPAQRLEAALAELVNRGSFHGSWLPLRITMADGVWFSEKAILVAKRVGWITRGNYDPHASREFMVFGVSGHHGNKLARLDEMHRSLLCYHWITSTTKWLEPDFVREMLIGGGVL